MLIALERYARWQLGSRITPGATAVEFAGGARLMVRPGMQGATGNVYVGLHDFEDMAFVVHALRPGDLFVDVGANVGSYTVLASRVAGAQSIAIEPADNAYEHLLDNINLNRLAPLVEPIQAVVGSQAGEVAFSVDEDATNHVVAADSPQTSVRVVVKTLDEILGSRQPCVLKIDVEGYEAEVIAGAQRTLDGDQLQAIVMETNGSGARYGFDDARLHRELCGRGFEPHRYNPFERRLVPSSGPASEGNTLFVRDAAALNVKVSCAPPFTALSETV